MPHPVGVIGRAVGASFAVLLAEQLLASGCRTLVSVTSSGRIAQTLPDGPHFILIERALRDEGTSHHYMPPAAFATIPNPALIARVAARVAVEAPDLTVLAAPPGPPMRRSGRPKSPSRRLARPDAWLWR